MKKRIQLFTLVMTIAAAGLIAGSLPSFAAGGDAPPAWAEMGGGPSMGRGQGMARFAEALGLSAEQVARIKAIREEGWKSCAPLKQALEAKEEAIHAAIKTVPFDENKVRALAQEKSATQAELTVARAKTRSLIFALLTPEQREKADQMMAERRAQRGPGGRHCNWGKKQPAGAKGS